jgi:hypothetical protein
LVLRADAVPTRCEVPTRWASSVMKRLYVESRRG